MDEQRVPTELAGRPLDGVVRALFGVSWGDARRWVASGKVSVDGAPALNPEKRVRAGARVALAMSAVARCHDGARTLAPGSR